MRWTRISLIRSLGGVALSGLLASSLMVGLTAANVELKRGQDQGSFSRPTTSPPTSPSPT